MLKMIAIVVMLFGVTSAMYNYPMFKSCKEILDQDSSLVSGLYWIKTPTGPLQVYCEMAVDGGGYTFLPRTAINSVGGVRIWDIFKEKDRVLLRYQRKDGSQPYTLLKQLPAYSRYQFSVLKNSYSGYTKPVNVPHLGPFLFLGILPQRVAKVRYSTQGFSSNGRSVTFRNCDGNPNSYFAFFPNHNELNPLPYHAGNLVYESQGVAVEWRRTGKKLPSHRTMPNDFMFLTELHFGGCGTYTSSDRWKEASGAAIGLR